MIAPRWRKALRDIARRPGRSLLAVLAMAAGLFALATITFKYAILRPVLGTMYSETRPASATLLVDHVDDALVDSVRRVAGVADAEARIVILSRVRVGADEWTPAILYVVRDFDRQRMDLFTRDEGAWPPGPGDVLLERSAVRVARVKPGERLTLRQTSGEERALRFAGTVHAAGLAPAWMEHVVYGFVPWTSLARGEDARESAQIRIVVADYPMDEGYIREVTERVRIEIQRRGAVVRRVDVPVPGRHPHADQMETFLYLLAAFGILSFVMSAVLVAGMTHALLAEQTREIGILKAIGATSRQIAGIYLAQVAALAAAALLIGVPLGLIVGRAYAQFSASILNADVSRSPLPIWAIAALAIVGIAVPLLVALGPVVRASRITVRQALADDPGPRGYGAGAVERLLLRLTWLPRPLMLSLRTTFLQRGRLILTITTLAIGGAVFMSALNVSAAWTRAVVGDFDRRHYDVTVRLAESTPIRDFSDSLLALSCVERVESWPSASPYLIGANGAPGNPVSLVGPVAGNRLLELPVRSGRWLVPGDSNAAVVNDATIAKNPQLRVGGVVRLRLDERTLAFPIVGVVHELFPLPTIYAPARAVYAVTGQSPEHARTIRVVTRGHDDSQQRAATRDLEQLFERLGIGVSGIQPMSDVRGGILDHLVIILTVLTMAAVIVVFVGALGLTSTLTIQVVQRTREIGVLSAIGATPRTIAGHVWFESVLLAVMSWTVAVVLAAPVSDALEVVTGRMFFRAPLAFTMSAGAAGIWFGLVVVLASLSSLYPAWRASRLSVREAVSHV